MIVELAIKTEKHRVALTRAVKMTSIKFKHIVHAPPVGHKILNLTSKPYPKNNLFRKMTFHCIDDDVVAVPILLVQASVSQSFYYTISTALFEAILHLPSIYRCHSADQKYFDVNFKFENLDLQNKKFISYIVGYLSTF